MNFLELFSYNLFMFLNKLNFYLRMNVFELINKTCKFKQANLWAQSKIIFYSKTVNGEILCEGVCAESLFQQIMLELCT